LSSQLLTKRRKTLGKVTKVWLNSSISVVQQMPLPSYLRTKEDLQKRKQVSVTVVASIETSRMSVNLQVDENHEKQHSENVDLLLLLQLKAKNLQVTYF
jgi:hypothetical protein